MLGSGGESSRDWVTNWMFASEDRVRAVLCALVDETGPLFGSDSSPKPGILSNNSSLSPSGSISGTPIAGAPPATKGFRGRSWEMAGWSSTLGKASRGWLPRCIDSHNPRIERSDRVGRGFRLRIGGRALVSLDGARSAAAASLGRSRCKL